jgi:hypothetical protein
MDDVDIEALAPKQARKLTQDLHENYAYSVQFVMELM